VVAKPVPQGARPTSASARIRMYAVALALAGGQLANDTLLSKIDMVQSVVDHPQHPSVPFHVSGAIRHSRSPPAEIRRAIRSTAQPRVLWRGKIEFVCAKSDRTSAGRCSSH